MEAEWKTRKTRIDPRLDRAGWESGAPRSGPHRREEHPTDHGPADYTLCAGDRVLGVVEAKKVTIGPQNVLTQAERYAAGLSSNPFHFDGLHVPFLYATNGELIWFHDVRHPMNRSRKVAGFHTPAALQDLLDQDLDAATARLRALPNQNPRLREYQRQANQAVEAAIRVLFLVDRRALAAQAVRTFASYEPEPGLKFNQTYDVFSNRFQLNDFGEDEKFDPRLIPQRCLEAPKPSDVFVYVCTIQRMAINILGRDAIFGAGDEAIDADAEPLNIPISAFDVVIADECHRGYTSAEESVWRATLDHFDAVKIGLTATPASHTTAYFKDVVFRYTYREAVNAGFLVDYDAVAEIEERITAPDSNRRLLYEVKKYADEHERRTGRFPKTLIFAANDKPHVGHANELVNLARDVFGRGEHFVTKITGARDVDRPLQRIREFRNRPNPGVAVTVDLLTTGVDIPDLEFLVLLRPVRSRILFEQMLGRGTRLGERFPDKTHFVVFDGFDGTLLRYFAQATDLTQDPVVGPTRSIREIIDDIWNNRERDYNIRCLVKRLHRIDRTMSGKAREDFAAFIPDGDMAR